VNGLAIYRPPRRLDATALACVTCHTLPTGMGTDYRLQGGTLVPIAPGPNGERHHMLVSVDGLTNISMKVPQLRNDYQKVGFDMTQPTNRAGFGLLHDGSVDSIERFVAEPVFSVASDQEVADLVAFILSFTGSELPQGTTNRGQHRASGRHEPGRSRRRRRRDDARRRPRSTTRSSSSDREHDRAGDAGRSDSSSRDPGRDPARLVLHRRRRVPVRPRLGTHRRRGTSGRGGTRSELTYAVVPRGSAARIGVDRDLDGCLDRDELDAGSDPADPSSHACGPGATFCAGDGTGAAPCPCGNFGEAGRGMRELADRQCRILALRLGLDEPRHRRLHRLGGSRDRALDAAPGPARRSRTGRRTGTA
jgi:hypothetical protein